MERPTMNVSMTSTGTNFGNSEKRNNLYKKIITRFADQFGRQAENIAVIRSVVDQHLNKSKGEETLTIQLINDIQNDCKSRLQKQGLFQKSLPSYASRYSQVKDASVDMGRQTFYSPRNVTQPLEVNLADA